ncbi:uncharacterized protein [Venturia canescens]|uniref:uncharacterized protein n=1 Tax=Venturia canescens TaxID=32260 RepID=UPI001C9C8178|nr:uncharacterized protein LOC122415065 [Venturia canescens]
MTTRELHRMLENSKNLRILRDGPEKCGEFKKNGHRTARLCALTGLTTRGSPSEQVIVEEQHWRTVCSPELSYYGGRLFSSFHNRMIIFHAFIRIRLPIDKSIMRGPKFAIRYL